MAGETCLGRMAFLSSRPRCHGSGSSEMHQPGDCRRASRCGRCDIVYRFLAGVIAQPAGSRQDICPRDSRFSMWGLAWSSPRYIGGGNLTRNRQTHARHVDASVSPDPSLTTNPFTPPPSSTIPLWKVGGKEDTYTERKETTSDSSAWAAPSGKAKVWWEGRYPPLPCIVRRSTRCDDWRNGM